MKLARTALLAAFALVATSCTGSASEPEPAPNAPQATSPATTAPGTTTISPDTATTPAPTTTSAASSPPATTLLPEPADQRLFQAVSEEPIVRRSDPVRDARFVAPGAVIVADGIFHMFSGGFDTWPGESTVAYYTSLDGVTWTSGSPEPVLNSSDVAIAQPGTMGHSAVQDERGRWVLYFHTFAGDDEPGFIGRATAVSPVGPWTADTEPVLAPGAPGSWDEVRLSRPQVVDTGRGLMMYYSGFDETGTERIGVATSPDGETWTKYDDPGTVDPLFADSDPVLAPESDWEGDRLLRPAVALSPDGFVMLYQNGRDFGMAFSGDGISWSRAPSNPVVTADDAPSGTLRLFQGSLVYRNGTYFFYVEAGNDQGADVFVMTHEGTFRDPAEIDGPVVETLVPRLEIATGGVALDAAGNLYVADFGAGGAGGTQLFRVSPTGEVSVHADDPLLVGASGNTVTPDGTVYQSSFSGGRVVRIGPDGTVELFADEGVLGPVGVVVDPTRDAVFVADCSANTIIRLDAEGNPTTFASDQLLRCPNGLTTDDEGTLYVANFTDGRVLAVSPEGEVSTVAVVPGDNNGHLAYFEGDLYVVGRGAHGIFKVTLDGGVTPIAGSGDRGLEDGFAIRASLSLPNGIAVAPDGTIYVNHVATEAGNTSSPTTVRVIKR